MDFVKVLLDQFLTNPAFQGVMISLIVAKLRDVFKSLDAQAKDPDKVKNVQLLVLGLSVLTTLLSGWAGGHLAQVDPQTLVNFTTVILTSLGLHQAGKDVKAAIGKK